MIKKKSTTYGIGNLDPALEKAHKCGRVKLIKKTMIYDVGNPGHSLEQAQRCGRVKLI
jgi:hypothetical protein